MSDIPVEDVLSPDLIECVTEHLLKKLRRAGRLITLRISGAGFLNTHVKALHAHFLSINTTSWPFQAQKALLAMKLGCKFWI